jgi:hypothetical protein
MPVTRRDLYNDAVKKLAKYNPSVSSADYISLLLAGGDVNSALSLDNPKSESAQQFSKIANEFVDIINGGSYTLDTINKMNGFLSGDIGLTNALVSPIRQFLRITLPQVMIAAQAGEKCAEYGLVSGARSFGPGARAGVTGIDTLKPGSYNKNGETGFYNLDQAGFKNDGTNPANNELKASKQSPHVTVIELLDSRIGPAVRDTAGLSIFTSMIPTHVISRAVPYVSVSVITTGSFPSNNRTPVAGNFNLIRYLKGPIATSNFQSSILPMIQLGNGSPKPGGMEIFTAPQTLVSDLDDISSFFSTKPVDRFRPLMTLNSLSLDIVPAGAGMMSYKNASMNVTLHDRGRLSEIAPLVQPGAYKDTEIEIEYGWSIDPGSKNATNSGGTIKGFALEDDVFAQLLDSMRCRERFGVVNSTFNFDDAGQVNIALTLFTKSAYEMRSMDISAEETKDVAKKLKSAIEGVNELISSKPGIANFISEAMIDAASSAEAAVQLDKEKLAKLTQELNKLRGQGAKAGSLGAVINALDGVLKTAGEFQTDAETGVGKVISTLKSDAEIFPPTAAIAQSGISKTKWGDYGSDGSVSLGRVVLHLVAKILARTQKFDEIQLVFGKINSRAGKVRNLSMAAFPIDIGKLEADLKKLYKEKLNVSVAELIGLIGVSHVSNVGYPAYGFASKYKDDELTGTQNDIDAILKAAGINDANFVLPKLYMHAECVPAALDSKAGPAGGTILRLFIGDEQCTPHQAYSELVNTVRTDTSFFLDKQGLSSESKNPEFKETYWADLDPLLPDSRTKAIEELVKKKVVVPVAQKAPTRAGAIDLTKLLKAGDPAAVKRFISEGMPVIRYGNGAGMLKNINVASISDPALSTINIIAADEASGDAPDQMKKKGLPMIVTPTEVTVDMLGCSLINFGQSVYIDFGTGTTIDNIYACVGVNHSFSPGEFTTSAKFVMNVGAYGIYNSVKRQLELTRAQAEEVNGFDVLIETVQKEINKPIRWGTLGGNEVLVKLSDFNNAVNKNGASAIRVWFASAGAIPAGQIIKSMPGHSSVEIVTADSASIAAMITGESAAGLGCYEMPYPTNAGVTVKAKKYEKAGGGVLETTPVKIDLRTLRK